MTNEDFLCLSRIRKHYEHLSNTEQQIADLILSDWKRIIDMPVAQIACEAGVSQATVVRFCRSIGFDGVPELKLYLKRERLSPLGELSEVEDDDTPAVEMDDESAARVFTEEDDREIEHLTSMMAQLSYDTLRIVSATIAEAYRLDREKGNLRPDERVISVRTKWLDEDKGKSEV